MARRSADAIVATLEATTAVAERAYFKAQERGFAPGHELDDWLAAERELFAGAKPAGKTRRAAPRRNNAPL